jgi:hypothetical protein
MLRASQRCYIPASKFGRSEVHRMAANQPATKPVPSAGMLMTVMTLVCALTAPAVLYVKGMDSLLNSPSTAAWALLPIALGILGLRLGMANLRKSSGGVDGPARSFAQFATAMAVVLPVITALIVLFLAWVNGPGGG